MKITPLLFGLLLVTGAALPIRMSGQNTQFSTPARKDSSSSLSGKSGSPSPTPDGPQVDNYGPNVLEDTVLILGVTQQKPDASGSRKVTVRARYALVHYPKGIVSLGFNLKSATQFVRVTDQLVVAGSEEIELSAVVVPVAWPKAQPFKVSVSLSAEPHPGQSSLLAAMTQALKPLAVPAATAASAAAPVPAATPAPAPAH